MRRPRWFRFKALRRDARRKQPKQRGSWHQLHSLNWRVAGLAALAAGLLVPAGLSPVAVHAQTPRATSTLLAAAALHPQQRFDVIVQSQGPNAGLQTTVGRLGGRVTGQLALIHAFTAQLPGRAVRHLATTQSVNWVSPNARVHKTSSACCSASTLQETYTQSIGAAGLWSSDQGSGIGVAIVDSGVAPVADLTTGTSSRIVAQAKFNSNTNAMSDGYGHGTHVAGIVAGNGTASNGGYVGVAPQANIINVKVSDDQGLAYTSDVVNGLQWVYTNRAPYNIRVVNLSLNSAVADSYQVDPLDAAVETLWKGGIVVVVSAGNSGVTNAGVMYAPADDPFVITVGAVDEHGTSSTKDDSLAPFSSYGVEASVSTLSGGTTSVSKPELVAPGVNIISDLASNGTTLAQAHPDHVVTSSYFRMSGTSMAAPMVAGVVALLLQANPSLTPDQVKYRLMSSATALGLTGSGAGEVNAAAALKSCSTKTANQNLQVAASLLPGDPAASWGSASWGSASWGSTDWSAASWGSASWGTASWGSASWGSASWGSDYWGS